MRRTLPLLLPILLCACAHLPTSERSPISITVSPDHVELTRDDNRHPFQLDITIRVDVAGGISFVPETVVLGVVGEDHSKVIYSFDPDVRFTAQKPFVKETTRYARESAMWHVTLKGREEGGPPHVVVHKFQVHNTQLKEALAKCDACNGEWGVHGMLRWEGCICRTEDVGERCLDGRDCRGRCMFKRYELVQAGQEPRCDKDGKCSARLAIRRAVGQCSEFEFVYGCHSFVRDGASDNPPGVGQWRASRICVD